MKQMFKKDFNFCGIQILEKQDKQTLEHSCPHCCRHQEWEVDLNTKNLEVTCRNCNEKIKINLSVEEAIVNVVEFKMIKPTDKIDKETLERRDVN